MKTQRKKSILGGIAVLVGAFALGLYILNERENNRHINPNIYPAFRAIEQSCVKESFPNQTVRCQQVLRMMVQCHNNVDECSAEEYYELLNRLGFRLPPFYEPGYFPKRWWQF